MTTLTGAPVRRRIRVGGVVQGVGYRPFVHRVATELGLAGFVGNDSDGVFIEAEGDAPRVALFESRLIDDAPPLARVFSIDGVPVPPRFEDGFRIVDSQPAGSGGTFVAPDVAVCDDCLAELFDPADRRGRYPFINCTNCGPRFTITLRLPYDRQNTTMRHFAMCGACASEYHDPADRRFHAQPVACADCGPRLWFEAHTGTVDGTDGAISATQLSLLRGDVVAIKGLGGYHLACDASSGEAVETLRHRKARLDKPLAVMVGDLATARTLAHVSEHEAALLSSPERPIVLLARRRGAALAEPVAPRNPHIGILLPYTPVHHLLFHRVPGSTAPVPTMLVMTSGNLTDEPICFEDDDARRRLAPIADAWLVHDRPIHVPCDDSVLRSDGGNELPIRRSRGYAPLPVRLPFEATPLLATGGELKNTFCVAAGHNAWVSQHIGDMGSLETLSAFERSARQFDEMYQVGPQRLATDAHPGYLTRLWAEEHAHGLPDEVQHHHAHLAAVMAEHGVPAGERVIGFAFDGTGFGSDGAIWGGEVLIAGYDGFERAAHLRYVPLVGGDASVRKPYRAALAHLWAAGIEWGDDLAPVRAATPTELRALRQQLGRGVHTVPTSSMGRLFDAVSSLLGLRHTATYEAQAAIELEWIASGHVDQARLYQFAVDDDEIDAAPLLRALVDDARHGCPVEAMAAGFHVAVALLIAEVADRLRHRTGIARIALSGGVFQNVLLLRLARAALATRRLDVLTHHVVPPNDGGLALGQAAVVGYTSTASMPSPGAGGSRVP